MSQILKLWLCVIGGIGLSGCVTLKPEKALTMTSFDLCKVIYDSRSNKSSRPIAAAELSHRGYDCEKDKDAIFTSLQIEAQREIQKSAALQELGAKLLQQSQPQQPVII